MSQQQNPILGWAVMGVLGSTQDIKNPSPLFLECHNYGKSGIIHLFRKDSQTNWKVSACNDKIRMVHSGVIEGTHESYFRNTEDGLKSLLTNFLPCPDCLKIWNSPAQ